MSTRSAEEVVLDDWEIANPERAIRYHGIRQAWAFRQMERCMDSDFTRFAFGGGGLVVHQRIQADAGRKMAALVEVMRNG